MQLPVISFILAVLSCFLWLLFDVIDVPLVSKIRWSIPFIVSLFIYMLYTTKKYYGYFNVLFMLLFLSFFFYYGQHFVVLFDLGYLYKISEDSIISGWLPDSVYVEATYIIIICLLLLHAGFFSVKDFNVKKANNKLNVDKLKALRTAGWVGLLISSYPMIRYQVSLFTLQMTLGYGGRRELEGDTDYLSSMGLSGLMIYVAGLFLPSLYALLIGYKGKRNIYWVYILIAIYLVMNLILGSRFVILKTLVVLLFIQFVWITPPSKKTMKKLIIAGLVLVVLFGAVTKLRDMTADSISLSDATEAADGLGISSVLWETGITFTCVSAVLAYCPSKVNYSYGASVLGALLQCIPEPLRFGFFDNHKILLSSIFSPLYYNTTLFGFGSSFIAEGYWNFGYFVFIYMYILGYFLGKMQVKLNNASITSSPFLFLLLSSICGDLVFGVRNDLSSIPRILLTNTFVIFVLTYLFYILTLPKLKK